MNRPVPEPGQHYTGSRPDNVDVAQYLADLVIWEPVPGGESLNWFAAIRLFLRLCEQHKED